MTTNYEDIERIFNKNYLQRKALDWATNLIVDKAKSHFGIVMKFNSYKKISEITRILEKLDKNFKKHTTNNYYNDGSLPMIEGKYIIRVEKANAFIYVSGECDRNRDTGKMENTIMLYLFGKGAFRLERYIQKKISLMGDGELVNYAVTASKRGDSSYWSCIANDIPPRSFDTLFFDNNVIDTVKDHLDKWIANAGIYKSRNLNFKTGILIHGPAGTGKSSLAVAIATYLKCNLISIDMATFDDLDIVDLVGSINADKEMYVVFLDEIDVVFKSRDESITDEQKERTTKLLTFFDSANSPSNVIFVATTNYPERLDSAVTRKGRFDLTVHVDNLSKATAESMCHGFGTSLDKVNAETLPDGKYNPATLQAAILNSMEHEETV